MKISKIDSNMASSSEQTENIKWFSAFDDVITINGLPFFDENKNFNRLPNDMVDIISKVNANLPILAEMPSGATASFRTDSKFIFARVKLKKKTDMCNMTAVAQGGFDCYIAQGKERYKFYGVTKFDTEFDEYESCMTVALSSKMKDVRIYFPLYSVLKSVEFGICENARVEKINTYKNSGNIVFYGTSITQGGCATRSGMAYPSIIGRHFDLETINLGFSANGLGEYELADVINRVKNTKLIVLDYEANGGLNGRLEASLVGFIERIRREQPNVKILVLSRIPYLSEFYDKSQMKIRLKLKEFQRSVVRKMNEKGDNNVFFVDGMSLMDKNFSEYTNDFIHLSDLGLYIFSKNLIKAIEKLNLLR